MTAWAEDMAAVLAEGGGLMALQVVRQVDVPGLIARAILGDPTAARAATAVSNVLKQISTAPRRKLPFCACCPRSLRNRKFSAVLVSAERDDPKRCILFGVCAKCATAPQDIVAKGVEALRRLWPDTRPVTIDEHPGHA
jgi:hypothetical protein